MPSREGRFSPPLSVQPCVRPRWVPALPRRGSRPAPPGYEPVHKHPQSNQQGHGCGDEQQRFHSPSPPSSCRVAGIIPAAPACRDQGISGASRLWSRTSSLSQAQRLCEIAQARANFFMPRASGAAEDAHDPVPCGWTEDGLWKRTARGETGVWPRARRTTRISPRALREGSSAVASVAPHAAGQPSQLYTDDHHGQI